MRRVRTFKYKKGDTRTVSKFLLFPVWIGNEMRWLERATIKQELVYNFDTTCGAEWYSWENRMFL